MLALAAADLASRKDDTNMQVIAISHRVKSIEALKKSIDSGIKTCVEGNAMLATCFALLFHSVFLKDGLGDYMSFIRGTLAIGTKMSMARMKFMFVKAFGNEQLDFIGPALKLAPLVPPEVTSAACKSLEKFGFLCEKDCERQLWARLLSVARNLVTSSQDGKLFKRSDPKSRH